MRSFILLGCFVISDTLFTLSDTSATEHFDKGAVTFIVIMFIVGVIMDFMEWYRKLFKNKWR
jgi:hypothetical protein